MKGVRVRLPMEPSPSPTSGRPRGRPPSGMKWDSNKKEYVADQDESSSEEYAYRKPRGPVPHGKKWDYDNGRWISDEKSTARKKPTVTYTQPRGRPPTGKKWNPKTGKWVRNSDAKSTAAASANDNNNTLKRPPDRAPKGKIWHAKKGYIDIQSSSSGKKHKLS